MTYVAAALVGSAQVLRLVCRGFTNDEIARELYVSMNTVKTHIRNAYQKVGLSRRTQIIVWGHEHGMT